MVLRNPYGLGGREEALMAAFMRNARPERFDNSPFRDLVVSPDRGLAALTGASQGLYEQSPQGQANRMELASLQAPVETQLYRDFAAGRGPAAGDLEGLQRLALAFRGADPLMAASPEQRMAMQQKEMENQVRASIIGQYAAQGAFEEAMALAEGKPLAAYKGIGAGWLSPQWSERIMAATNLDALVDAAGGLESAPPSQKIAALQAIVNRAGALEQREGRSINDTAFWSWVGGVAMIAAGVGLGMATGWTGLGLLPSAGLMLGGAGLIGKKGLYEPIRGPEKRRTLEDLRAQLETLRVQAPQP